MTRRPDAELRTIPLSQQPAGCRRPGFRCAAAHGRLPGVSQLPDQPWQCVHPVPGLGRSGSGEVSGKPPSVKRPAPRSTCSMIRFATSRALGQHRPSHHASILAPALNSETNALSGMRIARSRPRPRLACSGVVKSAAGAPGGRPGIAGIRLARTPAAAGRCALGGKNGIHVNVTSVARGQAVHSPGALGSAGSRYFSGEARISGNCAITEPAGAARADLSRLGRPNFANPV